MSITRKAALQMLGFVSLGFMGEAQQNVVTPLPANPRTEPIKVTNEFAIYLADATEVAGRGITSFHVTYKDETVTVTAAEMFAALKPPVK
jgi:hypothetical protein